MGNFSRMALVLRRCSIVTAFAVTICLPGTGFGQADVEARLARLERQLEAGTLIELLQSVQQLQREVQELRGELELQTYTLSQAEKRQRELYLDLDRRMQQVEVAGVQPLLPDTAPDTQVTQSPSTVATATPPPTDDESTVDPNEKRDYQGAFDLLKERRYDEATSAFRGFLDKYPSGTYSDNARYWLGESYYVTRQFKSAMTEFQMLIRDYPDSDKRTHAQLKVGFIFDELGQEDEARTVLQELILKNPGTSAAQLAEERLQRM